MQLDGRTLHHIAILNYYATQLHSIDLQFPSIITCQKVCPTHKKVNTHTLSQLVALREDKRMGFSRASHDSPRMDGD